jgi:D-alanyl-D-alanine carboxypeptidase
MKLRLVALSVVFSLGALAAEAAGPRPAPCVPRLHALLEAQMTQLRIPGLIVLVDEPGFCHFSAALGEEDVVAHRRMRIEDKMRIGSVTKTFTGTVVLQLVDEHLIGLDDAIGSYLPSVPNGNGISIRQLLQMRSGLYNYTDDPGFNATLHDHPAKAWTPDEVLAVSYAHPPNFAPGAQYEYSNTNSVLLGLLVEHVTQHSFETELERRILEPLRLRDTSFPLTAAIPFPHSHGYEYGSTIGTLFPDPCDGATVGPHDSTDMNPSWGWSAGQMISTLRDLKVWAKALAVGTLLTPETQAQRLAFLPVAPGAPIGYGLHVNNVGGLIGHNGSLPGFQSFMGYIPERGATLIVLANTDPDGTCGLPADDLAISIAKELGYISVP